MAKIEFKKGDGVTHYFSMPVDSWSAGGSLFFCAKTIPDNDVTDAAAVMDVEFDDTAIVDSSHPEYEADYVTYELDFDPADTDLITFTDGSKKKKYLGEFEFVPASGDPFSVPGNDKFLETIVYADIKRGV